MFGYIWIGFCGLLTVWLLVLYALKGQWPDFEVIAGLMVAMHFMRPRKPDEEVEALAHTERENMTLRLFFGFGSLLLLLILYIGLGKPD